MPKFCFYVKKDPSQECINTLSFQTEEEATEAFALHKQFSIKDFCLIYGVKEVENERTNTSQT